MSAPTPFSAPGSLSLPHLLSTLTPTAHPTTYVYLHFPPTSPPPPSTLPTHLLFHEPSGVTLISTLDAALAHNLAYTFPCRQITCAVHSSLEAVGLMAVLTRALAEKGVPVNVVSGFCHDHLFVPEGRVEEAVAALEGVVAEAKARGRVEEPCDDRGVGGA